MRLTLALLLIALNWTSSVVLAEDPEGQNESSAIGRLIQKIRPSVVTIRVNGRDGDG